MIRSIKEVIKVLEVDTDALKSCESLDDEYYTIKLCFRRHVLLSHPDRPGGDPQRFREVYEAWDTIREFYESGRIQDSFVSKSSLKKRGASKASYTFVPSFAEFEDIIGQDLAIYRLEPARSGRSQCKNAKCGASIYQGELRVGYFQRETGSYGMWKHLRCSKIPSKVWFKFIPTEITELRHEQNAAALFKEYIQSFQPNEDVIHTAMESLEMNKEIFEGYKELNSQKQQEFRNYCLNTENWANYTKGQSKIGKPGFNVPAIQAGTAEPGVPVTINRTPTQIPSMPDGTAVSSSSTLPIMTITKLKSIPKPGDSDYLSTSTSLNGITFVMTGVFPQIGGGTGLNLGKERTKALIQSFGGRVTGAISGKTDILLIGEQPGASKVSKARHANVKLLTINEFLNQLKTNTVRDQLLSDPHPELLIDSFSSGFRDNQVMMDAEQLAIAQGTTIPSDAIELPHSAGVIGSPSRMAITAIPPGAIISKPTKPKPKKKKATSTTSATTTATAVKAETTAIGKGKKTKVKAKTKTKGKSKATSKSKVVNVDMEVEQPTELGLGLGLEPINIDENEAKEEKEKEKEEEEAEKKEQVDTSRRHSSRKRRSSTLLDDFI